MGISGTYKLIHRQYPDVYITITNRDILNAAEKAELTKIVKERFNEDCWIYNDKEVRWWDFKVADTNTQKDGDELIFTVNLEVEFHIDANGWYNEGKLYGPPEKCEPPDSEIDDFEEIEFKYKEFTESILWDIQNNELLKNLEIDDIDTDCGGFTIDDTEVDDFIEDDIWDEDDYYRD